MTTTATPSAQGRRRPPSGGSIDPRGPQFAAALTAVVLAAVLLLAQRRTPPSLLAVQAVLFAIGAVARGAAHAVRLAVPHARPPAARRRRPSSRTRRRRGSPRPSASASRSSALVGFAAGADRRSAQVATGFALVAALLNAVFGFCLGCEMYLLLRRVAPGRSRRPSTPTHRHHQPDRPRTTKGDTT